MFNDCSIVARSSSFETIFEQQFDLYLCRTEPLHGAAGMRGASDDDAPRHDDHRGGIVRHRVRSRRHVAEGLAVAAVAVVERSIEAETRGGEILRAPRHPILGAGNDDSTIALQRDA